MRIKAIIEYDGSKFNGFQIQKNKPNSVANHLQNSLKALGIDSKIVGSGRTDSNVHATFQVIHFDVPLYWQNKNIKELQNKLNKKLKYIKIKYIAKTSLSFHAQYSAKIRVYRYLIKITPLKVFEQDYITYKKINNLNLIKKGLELFEGEHNFKFFKKKGSLTTTDIRTIYKTKIVQKKDYIAIYIFANGFLRAQVRLIISSLFALDNKKITISNLKEQILGKKHYIFKPAPANGLYLNRVFY